MKNPKPGYTDTPAQQQPRQDMRDAVLRYQLRNFSEKTFLDKRSKEIPGNQYSLFIRKYMKDEIWSRAKPIGLETIENLVIQNPVGSQIDNAIISIEAIITTLLEMGCQHWNKLGSNDEVDNSEIGADGIRTGIMQYLAAKFGNGVYNTTYTKYITFFDVHVFNEGIIDNWWIPDFNSTDTLFDHAELFSLNYVAVSDYLLLGWSSNFPVSPKTFYMHGWVAPKRCRYYFTPLPFSADDKIHLEWIINFSRSSGNRFRLFQNGTELSTSLITHDNELHFTEDDYAIQTLSGPLESKAIIDNIKSYPVDKYEDQIKANREFENFSPDPIVIDSYGHVSENGNIFTPGEDIVAAPAQRIAIQNTGTYDLEIPFRYYVAVTWSGPGVSSRTSLIRFPEMTIPIGETAYLYLSQDWSTYYDKELRNLACTNKM